MRWFIVVSLVVIASSASAQEDRLGDGGTVGERWRIELAVSGERHYARMIAETPEGGEDEVAVRIWTGGLDLCAMGVARPWVHLGGCLGLHVVPGNVPWGYAGGAEDVTLGYLARMQLRATFRSPKYIRGGVDLHYRSYLRVRDGRESALEAGFRLGAELQIGERETPLIVGVSFRAPLLVTRSESSYAWPVSEFGVLIGRDSRPTRDVRIFALGLFVGSAFSFR